MKTSEKNETILAAKGWLRIYGMPFAGGGHTVSAPIERGTPRETIERAQSLGFLPFRVNAPTVVEVDQHNGSVLTLRTQRLADLDIPSDKVHPTASFEVTLIGGITDRVWADTIHALRDLGYEVGGREEAPSERLWQTWPNNVHRSAEPDPAAIAEVRG